MKTYKLENLTCAHCAATIEETLKGMDAVRTVRLQFATLDLHLDTDDLAAVKTAIASVEPGVSLVDPEAPVTVKTPSRFVPAWVALAAQTLTLAVLLVGESVADWKGGVVTLALALLYAVAGWPVLKSAVLGLKSGRWFDENFLMAAATLAAWAVGAGAEAVSVMVFYQWGEFLQGKAVESSRRSLGALLASRPRTARIWLAGAIEQRSPDSVVAGEIVEVWAGEQVPLDGVVLEGVGSIDTGALTGESLPHAVEPGTEVAAGSMNLDAVLRLRVTRPFAESAWAGIIVSVDEALSRKAPLERFITRFARVYTPTVLVLALVLFSGLTLAGVSWTDSLYRSLVLLVISCPCALVVSIPLTYLGAIGAASRQGLLIRDAGALDRLARVDFAAFDKTGTLTEGRPQVQGLTPQGAETELRACLEAGFAASSHPLARAWGSQGAAPEGALESRGQGVAFPWRTGKGFIGRKTYLKDQGVPGVPEGPDADTTVHAGTHEGYLGRVDFDDRAKPDTELALSELRSLGLERLALLSGDVHGVVEPKGRAWGFDHVHGELLPQDKLALVDAWEGEGRKVLFVGDGMNDAPVLARASVGVSLGAGASAAAIETADVSILDGSPRQVARLVRMGRRTRVLLYQNITLALALKALFMVLGGLGLAGLWEAVFADVGVALLAVANSLRAGQRLD